MHCTNCNHYNEGGKFCESCGAKLPVEVAATSETAGQSPVQPDYTQQQEPVYHTPPQQTGYPGSGQPSAQPNVYLQNAKKVSRSYFNYFGGILKRPFSASHSIGGDQLVNGIITMVLLSLIAPLMVYFTLGARARNYLTESPFLDIVVKPALSLVILILLIATFCYCAVRLAKVHAGYRDVIARFGAMLVPFLGLMGIAFVLSILQIEIFGIFLVGAFLGLVFIAPPLVITSWVKQDARGLDAVYGVLLTYIATFITLDIIGKAIVNILDDIVPGSMFF
ncbi:zinc ribbon domain-containing protein [Paenibacillus sp. YPG26]|uniref:zinc ribbon domain-containing protein n=1 Tax=Paenibacillus sp. YPG26 TaxID=2878915 RepID=UPI00203B16B0|nr:zinc ribbon domain-containing protein [Paenibacillus sp. YPG26]USB33055.1 zinc ribbon domain-containing protein [Paenibacillus sp. YPG26]